MTRLLEIQQELAEVSASLARLEGMASTDKPAFSITLSLGALRRRMQELEAQFAAESAEQQVDICRYRLFRTRGTPNALASATSLAEFQELVSHVYDVLRTKAKTRARTSVEAVKETSFQIGYVFPGSLGFVLTLPKQIELFDDGTSPVDESIETIFAFAGARSLDAISTFAKSLGPSVVRLMHRWLVTHNSYAMGMDIQWHRLARVKSKLFIQPQELAGVIGNIEQTSQTIEEDVVIEGEYVGGDVEKQTYHMKVPGAADVNAAFHESFDSTTLPSGFRVNVVAHFVRRTTTVVVTGDRDVKYALKKVEPA